MPMTIVYRTNTWLHRKKRLCCQSDSRVAKLSTIYILVWPTPFPKCFDVIACTWNQLRRTTLSRIAPNQDKSSWPNASSSTSAIPEVTRASYPEETGKSETTCPPKAFIFCGHFLEHAKMLCFLWWTCVLSRSRKLSLHCWYVRRFWYDFDGLYVCVCAHQLSSSLSSKFGLREPCPSFLFLTKRTRGSATVKCTRTGGASGHYRKYLHLPCLV